MRNILVLIIMVFLYAELPLAAAQAPTSGLAGYWTFDEGLGSVAYDSSGNGNNGIITGAAWTAGKFGQALSFDNIDDYITMGDQNSLDFGTSDFSISVWLKRDKTGGDSILGKGISGEARYTLLFMSDGTLRGTIRDTSSNYKLPATINSISDTNWHNIVAVFDRDAKASFYVDGNKWAVSFDEDISSVSGDVNNARPFKIGVADESGDYFSGLIDDVRIYNRALSAQEISDLYNGTGIPALPDTTPPSTPTNLAAAAVSSSQISLSWSASTDPDVSEHTTSGVSGYKIFRDGVQIAAAATTSYQDTGLYPSTTYSYTLSAYDAAGNPSAQSIPVSATTQSGQTAGGNTYYVSASTGSDTNPGTINSPWKTIAKVNAGSFSPRDSILFKKGETWTETLTVPSSGTSGNPITFGSYGSGGKPIIDATGLTYGIYGLSKDYITITGFEIKNANSYGIRNYHGDGWLVTLNTIHHIGPVGIAWPADGIAIQDTTNNIISHNIVHDAGWHGISTMPFGLTSVDNVVEYNTVYNIYHSGIDIGTSDGNSSGNIVRYNELYADANYSDWTKQMVGIYVRGWGGGYVNDATQVYYNLCHNLPGQGIQVSYYSTNAVIYSNTVAYKNSLYAGWRDGILVETTGVSGIVLKNNIVYGFDGGLQAIGTTADFSAVDYNDWYTAGNGPRVTISNGATKYRC